VGVIPSSDARTWYLQYNSGIFYQDITTYTAPLTASVYVYIGQTLKSQPNTPYSNTFSSENTVGGLKSNDTFTNVSANSIFDMMLYPSLQPSITSFTIQNVSSYEVGYAQPSGTYTMSWVISNTSSLTSNSAYIYGTAGTAIYGPTNNAGPISNTFPTLQYSVPVTLTYSLSVLATSGIRITSQFGINWNYAVYYGSSTQSGLTNSFNSFQKSLTGTPYGTYILPGGTYSTYKYIIVPDSFGTISNIAWNNMPIVMADTTDGYTFSANNFNYKLVNYSNVYSVATNYKIYRTKYMMAATMSNVIIS